MEQLMDAKQLGKLVKKDPKQISPAMLAKWGLPVIRLDRKRLFRVRDVEKMIQRWLVEPPIMPSRARRDGSENAAD